MMRLYFKSEEEYIAWNEGGYFLTAIYDGDDFLCDIQQKDFFYLVEIGFVDRNGNVIPPLDIEQREMFKDSWGIYISYPKDWKELYDEVCRVLTWYEHPEEYPLSDDDFNRNIAKEMYDVLVRVQNGLY